MALVCVDLKKMNSKMIYKAICISFDRNKPFPSRYMDIEYSSRPRAYKDGENILLRARGCDKNGFFVLPSCDTTMKKAENGKRTVKFTNVEMFTSFKNLVEISEQGIDKLFYSGDATRRQFR